jgi:hypothetical protein
MKQHSPVHVHLSSSPNLQLCMRQDITPQLPTYK